MAIAKKYQNNFTAGVMSPGVHARTDLQKYGSGCKRIVNGIVHAHGGISNRPGTYFIDEVAGAGCLIPFTYSVTQTYVLLFFKPETGDFAKMRIYKDGGAVCTPSGEIAEIETPYAPDEVWKVKFAQSADTMFLAHPSHPPMKLVRRANHLWEFSKIDFFPDIATPTGLKATATGFNDSSGTYVKTSCSYKVSAVNSRQVEGMPSDSVEASTLSTWPSGARVKLTWDAVEGADHYEVYKDERGYFAWLGSADTNSFTDNCIEGDSGTGPKENRDPFNPPEKPSGVTVAGASGESTLEVRVSALNSSGTESVASAAVTAAVTKESAKVEWETVEHGEAYNVYFRYSTEGEWKYVSVSKPENDSAKGSAELSDPKKHLRGNPPDKVNSYPGAVGIYQQRLVFGRSNLEPQTVWLSETGAFDSMAVSNPLRDDSAITATVDSKQMNEIRHFIPLRDVLMLTSGAEFQLSAGKNSDAVTPTTITFNLQSYWGSSDVPPIVSGTSIVFAENSGKVIRDLKYQLTDDGYTGTDVSVLAENLIDSPVRDWAYQQSPWSTIWICLESGRLLTFTYMKEQEIWAWSSHESSGAKFVSVTSIREGEHDNVYFLVNRGGRYFLEYQKRREYGDAIEESFFVDCGLSYDDAEHPISHITGLEHLAGCEVAALADGSVIRGLRVSETGTAELPSPAGKIAIGLGYETLVETLDPEVTTPEGVTVGLKKNVPYVTFLVRETRGLKAGPDEEHLTEVKFPPPGKWGKAPGLYSGEVNLVLPGLHREEATIVFKQEDPLPMTVLSLMTAVNVG
jgi:hypothetical protein